MHQNYIVFQWSFDAQLMTSTVYFSKARDTYHVGLVANFTGKNDCDNNECPTQRNVSGVTFYTCNLCRLRWRWLDGSELSSNTAIHFQWSSDQPELNSATFAHCVVAQLNATSGAYEWRTIECDGEADVVVCKAGACKFFFRDSSFWSMMYVPR